MKTLIFMLAAALASPALGDGNTTTTDTTSTSTTTSSPESYSGSGSMSGSGTSADATTLESESVDSQDSSLSGSATSDYNSDSSMSGSSSDSSMSGTSSDYQSGSATSSDMGATTTTTPSTTDTSSSLSGAATSPSTTAPATTAAPSNTTNVIVPPSSATAAPAAPPEQASRTYREEEDRGLKAGGFYLEPAVFGSQQENDFKNGVASAGAAPTTDATGFGLDLKLGGHINESFFLAADARYERATLKDQAFEDTDADVYNWGPVIGFQAPKYGLRAWGTYVVDGIYNPESAANGVDLEFKNPYGWRGGIGVRFEAVSVNLEYEDLTYRTTEIDSFGSLANEQAANVDFTQRGASLSLSFPVEL